MSRVVFDLESNGLLFDATIIWCISTHDIDSGESRHYTNEAVDEGVEYLLSADLLIGHNISGFDIPLIEKLSGKTGLFDRSKLRDTYVMSKLFYPSRQEHSLASWGKKVGIEKPEHEDWSKYSEEMRYRCDQDVQINAHLYDYLYNKECKGWPHWKRSVILEGEMHYWQAHQELYGVAFDKVSADRLLEQLDKEITDIEDILIPILPVFVKQVGATVATPFKKDGDYIDRVVKWFDDAAKD